MNHLRHCPGIFEKMQNGVASLAKVSYCFNMCFLISLACTPELFRSLKLMIAFLLALDYK